MSNIPLIVLTNGRECIHDTIAAARDKLSGWSHLIIVDDSGNEGHRQALFDRHQPNILHPVADKAAGYNAAMKAVWKLGRNYPDGVFFLEDDFIIEKQIAVRVMQLITKVCTDLCQVALLRQPWWGNEVEAGGVIQSLEKEGHVFEDQLDGEWTSHRAFFTGNPSYIPHRTFHNYDWPDGEYSEGAMGAQIFADPAARSAFLGSRTDGPVVRHVGIRSGFDY